MKKTLTVLLCAVFSALTSFAQNPVPAHFDECVELMATVWRLSGAEEYNRCRVPQYAHEVDSVFGPYKDHPAVQLARQYQNESGISYAWRDDKTLEVIFSLEPSHQYGFVVMGTDFPTKDGHSAGKNMEITFTTGK